MQHILDLGPVGIFFLLLVIGPPLLAWYQKKWTALITILSGYGIYAVLLTVSIIEGEKSGNWGAGTFLAIIGVPYVIGVLILAAVLQKNKRT